jgi:hypothetical protein
MGAKRNSYRLLVGKPEGRRPVGRRRHRWVDNIKMDLAEVQGANEKRAVINEREMNNGRKEMRKYS